MIELVTKKPQIELTAALGAGYEKGYTEGKKAGIEELEADIYFTNHGTMYRKHHKILGENSDGFYNYAYRYADKMESLYIPNLYSLYTAQTSVFEGCSSLKTAYLPKIQRIGANYFNGCKALEEITLGCEEYPMVTVSSNALYNCVSLKRINFIGTISTSLNLVQSPLLDDKTIETIIDSLADLNGATAQKLTFYSKVGERLTEEQKAAITAKNWALVY